MIGIQQEIRLRIPAHHILDMHLSVPDWPPEKIEATYGLLRDYPRARELQNRMRSGPLQCGFDDLAIPLDEDREHLCRPVRAYDVSWRRTYSEHLSVCVSFRTVKSVVAIGNGNLISNLGILGWVNQRGKHQLLNSAWEEKRMRSGWLYTCLYYDCGDRHVGIDKFSFQNGQPESKRNLAWLTSGQPILWDGYTPETEELIAETYDIRHVYTLRATSGNDVERKLAQHRIQEYMKAWMDAFENEPQSSAPRRLRATARQPEFAFDALRDGNAHVLPCADREEQPFIEKRYLQSAVGVNDQGDFFIVQKHGSMKELGATLHDMGARRGILLDQGGSVGTFYVPQERCQASDSVGKFILQARDFRPSRLCILALELNMDTWYEA